AAESADGGGGDDATATDSDAGSDGLPTACGTSPYVTVGIVVSGVALMPPAPLVQGAVLTSPLCPGVSLTSAADGTMTGRITQNVPFYGRVEAKAYAKTLTPEQLFKVDTPGVALTLPPSLLTALIPNYSATSTTIFLNMFKDGGHGPCNALDGTTFDVTGHPEAVVTYFSADAVPVATTGTSTTTGGKATITGLAPGDPVTVLGHKTGCTVTLVKDAATGRSPLEAGWITIGGVWIHD
ncbi:MAG: hypothetical protein ABIP39_09840, partial [Polyangiaceae bacterium]